MSYSFALKDGDLTTQGSVLKLVSGSAKLRQDIDLWLREIYGVNRFHKSYGSVLESYIGGIIGQRLVYDVTVEVHRVLTNLQNVQIRRLKNNPTKYTPDELLQGIISVNARIEFDTIVVTVVYQSASNLIQTTTVSVNA